MAFPHPSAAGRSSTPLRKASAEAAAASKRGWRRKAPAIRVDPLADARLSFSFFSTTWSCESQHDAMTLMSCDVFWRARCASRSASS
eukprot:2261152-Pyramimonas_sp.AAC.1